MTEMLARVREAREQATAQFIKDFAIHEMAALIAPVYQDILDEAIQRSKQNSKMKVADQIVRIAHGMFENATYEALRGNPPDVLPPDPEFVRIARKATLNFRDRRRYDRLIDHIRTLSDMISEYPLDGRVSDAHRERSRRAMMHFRDIMPKAVDRAENMFSRSRKGFSPETLVLQGGGAKGISYAGVAEVFLQDPKIRDGIRYVAGNSAGGMMSLLLVLGFTSPEIKSIVKNAQFAQFFAESATFFKLLTKPGLFIDRIRGRVNPKDRPYLQGFNLEEFAREYMLPELSHVLSIKPEKLLSYTDIELDRILRGSGVNLDRLYSKIRSRYAEFLLSQGRRAEMDVLKFTELPGRSTGFQACVNSIRSIRPKKNPDSDFIESFMGDVIEIAVTRYFANNPESPLIKEFDCPEKIRSMTFEQLKSLAEETDYKQFKELGVAITRSHFMSMSWFSRAYERTMVKIKAIASGEVVQDKGYGPNDSKTTFQPVFVRAGGGEYVDMPIKKAVRISMNLPVLFNQIEHNGGKYIDGGLNSNFPHRMFLDKFGDDITLAEEKTAGFMLSDLDSDLEYLAIDEMAGKAKRQIEIEIEQYPKGIIPKIRQAGMETSIFLHAVGVDLINMDVAGALNKVSAKAITPIKNAGSWVIAKIMEKNNVSIPSERILENTGVINTGSVGMDDFHLDVAGREELFRAGRRAALSLLSEYSDRHLRFSRDRLVSLISIENKMNMEQGLPPVLSIPSSAVYSSYRLVKALNKAHGKDITYFEAFSGSLSRLG